MVLAVKAIMATADGTGRFITTLRRRARPVDVLALLFVPGTLLVMFSLPRPTRETLVFSHANPTVATAYTAHFVHLEHGHLLASLTTYVLVVSATYLLCTVVGRRRAFYVVFTGIILVFPWVLSWLSFAVFDFGRLLGFSGVVMAFAGFLPLALFEYLHAQLKGLLGASDSPGLFLLGIALFAALTPVRLARLISVAVGVLGLVYLGLNVRLLRKYPNGLYQKLGRSGYTELAALGIVVFVTTILGAFPVNPTTETTVTNIYVHFLGYCLGYIAAYTTFVLSRLISAPPFLFR